MVFIFLLKTINKLCFYSWIETTTPTGWTTLETTSFEDLPALSSEQPPLPVRSFDIAEQGVMSGRFVKAYKASRIFRGSDKFKIKLRHKR